VLQRRRRRSEEEEEEEEEEVARVLLLHPRAARRFERLVRVRTGPVETAGPFLVFFFSNLPDVCPEPVWVEHHHLF
jgi:hypothetical protein